MDRTYKDTNEWKALNRIWKALTEEQQRANLENFQLLVAEMKIRLSEENRRRLTLHPLSEETELFMQGHTDEDGLNLHEVFIRILEKNSAIDTPEKLLNYYYPDSKRKRVSFADYRDELRELSEFCIIENRRKRVMKEERR